MKQPDRFVRTAKCACGCGGDAPIATENDSFHGYIIALEDMSFSHITAEGGVLYAEKYNQQIVGK